MKNKKDNKKLIEELRRAKEHLKIYQWLSGACRSYVDIDKLLNDFMAMLIKFTRVEAGSLLLKKDNRLYFKVARGKKAKPLKKITLEYGEGIVGHVAKSGRSIIANNAEKSKYFTKKLDKITGFKTRCVLAVPLKIKNRIIGAIELLNPVEKEFAENSLETLEDLSSQVAIFIENMRLFEETKNRFSEINTFFDISHIITSSLAQQNLLNSIMKSATRLLRAEAISLLLADDTTNELVFKVALGDKGHEIKEFRIPIDESSIAGWVAKKGEPLIVNDVNKDVRWNSLYSQKVDFQTKSILAVPLKVGDRIIGVAEAVNKADGFKQKDQDMFMAIANQIAMATENTKLNQDLRDLFFATVNSLVNAIETKDTYTAGHSERVTEYTIVLAREMKLSEEEIEMLRLVGMLHDIGKIGVMEGILTKADPLTEEDWKIIRQHPIIGAKILKPVKQMEKIIRYVLHHHERYDGKGYPSGLKGEEIPFYSRIIAIADTFDAMVSDRPYRKGLPVRVALAEIEKNRGIQFDPRLAEIFVTKQIQLLK